jgi:hypothetical protein
MNTDLEKQMIFRAKRLRRDVGINLSGIAVILDMLD